MRWRAAKQSNASSPGRASPPAGASTQAPETSAAGRVEGDPVGVAGHRGQPPAEEVPWLDASHACRYKGIGDNAIDLLGGQPVEIHRDCGGKDLDVVPVCRSMSRYFLGPRLPHAWNRYWFITRISP